MLLDLPVLVFTSHLLHHYGITAVKLWYAMRGSVCVAAGKTEKAVS